MSDDRFTSGYQSSEAMRAAFEQGINQARTLFSEMVAASERNLAAFQSFQAGNLDANRRIMAIAEANVTASLALAQRLARARDLDEVLAAHRDYIEQQKQRLEEDARTLADLARAASARMSEPAPDGDDSPLARG